MNSAEVVVAAVVVEVGGGECLPGTYGDAEGRVQLPGGVQKVPEFLNTEGANSSGNTECDVQKVGDFLNELVPNDAGQVSRSLTNIAEQPQSDPRATALGIGAAAPPVTGRMGRPVAVTPEVAERLCMLVAIGFSRRQAAAYLGFSPAAITNAVTRDPGLGEELARAEQISDMQPELTVMAEARKNWKAAAWYLEFKKRNPRPLSREEKEEWHREALEDNSRAAERSNAWLRDMVGKPLPNAPESEEPRTAAKTRQKRRAK